MQPTLLSFHCERIHYFFNSHYTVNTYQDSITITKLHSLKPKYVCQLTFENKLYWYSEQGQIHAFGIKYKKQIKFFKAKSKHLEELRNLVNGKIIFDGIVSFYKCIKQIGEGADSKVFKVEDQITKQYWALKCFERKDDFIQEIQIHNNLVHNNIVQFREYYEGEQYFYIVMELMNGLPLSKFIEKNGIPTHTQCKTIISSILNALIYLKKEFVIHRDIKPVNILFQQSGRADSIKLVDFNYAIHTYDQNIKPVPLGIYTAPEAIQEQPEYTDKMDVYSCGAILYKLYCGDDIFSLRLLQNESLFINYKNKHLIDFSQLEKCNTPRAAIKLIKAMLEPDPQKRVTAEQALQFEYFSSDSLSPIEKRSRFQNRYTNDSFKIVAGTADFEINYDDAKSAKIRGIEIHHHLNKIVE